MGEREKERKRFYITEQSKIKYILIPFAKCVVTSPFMTSRRSAIVLNTRKLLRMTKVSDSFGKHINPSAVIRLVFLFRLHRRTAVRKLQASSKHRQTDAFEIRYGPSRGALIDVLINQRAMSRASRACGGVDSRD